MSETIRQRYAAMVLAKLRAGLVTQDNYIFNNIYEGDPTSGMVKIPVRDVEVAVGDYNKISGIEGTTTTTTYIDLPIDNDKAVNEIIDGYDAAAVPDGIVAERLDSAGYAMGLTIDTQSINLLQQLGAPSEDNTPCTEDDVYTKIVNARTALSKNHVPTQGRWLIVSPELYGRLLLSKEFIKQGDLSQQLVQIGAVGQVAGFLVFESASLSPDVEFIAGHPNWCHRVMEWKVEPYVQDLGGDASFVGACAIKGRMVYGMTISRPETVYVKRAA